MSSLQSPTPGVIYTEVDVDWGQNVCSDSAGHSRASDAVI